MKGLGIILLGILLIYNVEAKGRSNKSTIEQERHQRQLQKNQQQQQQIQLNSNAPSSQEERSSEFVKGKSKLIPR